MKMKFQILKLTSVLALALSFAQLTQANDDIEVTPDSQITKQEFAAIYVISEICPSIVSDNVNFQTGFEKLVKEYLPNEANPVEALNTMVKQPDFKNILQEAETDAKNAGNDKNLAICEELAVYKK